VTPIQFNTVTNQFNVEPSQAAPKRLGGLCRTLFYKKANLKFGVDFTVKSFGNQGRVMPLWIGDSRGRVHALAIDQNGWRWQSFATHQKFRAGRVEKSEEYHPLDFASFKPKNATLSDEPTEGALALRVDVPYAASLVREGAVFKWTLAEAGSKKTLAGGELKLRDPECYQFGMGLVGDGPGVAFDNVYVQNSKP
jgi:hypothetical protein